MKKALLILATVLASALIVGSFALTQITPSKGQTQLNDNGYSDIGKILMRIDGIPGESKEPEHMDWIEILAFNWSEANKALSRAGGAAAGKVEPEDFHLVKMYDKSSPRLFLYCASGKHIKSADLEVTRSYGEGHSYVFIKYNFEDVVITFYQTSGDINRYPGVLDEFSLNFAKLKVTYTLLNPSGLPDGQVVASWDFVANKGA
jgi:type VI secretion system secreted protein Hcp